MTIVSSDGQVIFVLFAMKLSLEVKRGLLVVLLSDGLILALLCLFYGLVVIKVQRSIA